MAGCIFYPAGQLKFFPGDTFVQPDNQFPISHTVIVEAHENRSFEQLGVMPADFKEKLIKAVNASITINSRKKSRILKAIA